MSSPISQEGKEVKHRSFPLRPACVSVAARSCPTVGGSVLVSVNVTKKIRRRSAQSVSPWIPDPIKLSPRLNFTASLSQFRIVLCISRNATAIFTPFKCNAFVLSCLDNITSLSCYLHLLTQTPSANLWQKEIYIWDFICIIYGTCKTTSENKIEHWSNKRILIGII